MPVVPVPPESTEWATDVGAEIVEPSGAKKEAGWDRVVPGDTGTLPEKPPFQFFNFWQNAVYKTFVHLLDLTNSEELAALRTVANSPADLQVEVFEGRVTFGETAEDVAGGQSPVFNPAGIPIGSTRIDLLYADENGTLAIRQGVATPTPVPPTHARVFPIAEITLTEADTDIEASDIRDVRPIRGVMNSAAIAFAEATNYPGVDNVEQAINLAFPILKLFPVFAKTHTLELNRSDTQVTPQANATTSFTVNARNISTGNVFRATLESSPLSTVPTRIRVQHYDDDVFTTLLNEHIYELGLDGASKEFVEPPDADASQARPWWHGASGRYVRDVGGTRTVLPGGIITDLDSSAFVGFDPFLGLPPWDGLNFLRDVQGFAGYGVVTRDFDISTVATFWIANRFGTPPVSAPYLLVHVAGDMTIQAAQGLTFRSAGITGSTAQLFPGQGQGNNTNPAGGGGAAGLGAVGGDGGSTSGAVAQGSGGDLRNPLVSGVFGATEWGDMLSRSAGWNLATVNLLMSVWREGASTGADGGDRAPSGFTGVDNAWGGATVVLLIGGDMIVDAGGFIDVSAPVAPAPTDGGGTGGGGGGAIIIACGGRFRGAGLAGAFRANGGDGSAVIGGDGGGGGGGGGGMVTLIGQNADAAHAIVAGGAAGANVGSTVVAPQAGSAGLIVAQQITPRLVL